MVFYAQTTTMIFAVLLMPSNYMSDVIVPRIPYAIDYTGASIICEWLDFLFILTILRSTCFLWGATWLERILCLVWLELQCVRVEWSWAAPFLGLPPQSNTYARMFVNDIYLIALTLYVVAKAQKEKDNGRTGTEQGRSARTRHAGC